MLTERQNYLNRLQSAEQSPLWRRLPLWLMLGCLLLLCWRAWYLSMESGQRYLQVQFDVPLSTPLQLYYDHGYGFNEHDSVVVSGAPSPLYLWGIISVSPNKTAWLGGTPAGAVRFHVTPERIHALRLQYAGINANRPNSLSLYDGLGAPVSLAISSRFTNTDSSVAAAPKEGAPLHELTISLDRSLELQQGQAVIGRIFLRRLSLEGTLLLLAAFLFIVPVQYFVRQGVLKIPDRLREREVQDWAVFLFLTGLYFWGYRQLNDNLFPLLFWKMFTLFLIFLCILYAIRLGWSWYRLNIMSIFLLCYMAIITISGVMHGLALHENTTIDVVALNNEIFHGEIINIWKKNKYLFDLTSDSDQTAFLYFFPAVFFLAFSLMLSDKESWKKILYIPLLVAPNIALGWYFREEIVISDNQTFFLDSIVSLRILTFLLIPLCILGAVVVQRWFMKAVYCIIAIFSFWLSFTCYGRGALLAISLFFATLPFVKIWVDGSWRSNCRAHLWLGFGCLLSMMLVAGLIVPRFHGLLSTVLPKYTVETGHAILTGFITGKNPDPTRFEMNRQAVRLVQAAPVAGWGANGFPSNADRMRVHNGESNGVSHCITSIYLLLATNYGLVGLAVFSFFLIVPLILVVRVQSKIHSREERWAVGIVLVVCGIMLLLFKTNPFLSFVEINWLYCIYLGFLLSVGIRYGNNIEVKRSRLWLFCSSALLIMFLVGTYTTTFGAKGYAAVTDDLLSYIRRGTTSSHRVAVFDSRKPTDTPVLSTSLITTRATPWRLGYTTSQYLMDYGKIELPEMAGNTVYCVELTAHKEAVNFLFLWADVYVDGQRVDAFSFSREGTKLLFYDLPGDNKKNVKVHLRARWSVPYHADARREIQPVPYLPDHTDFAHLGLLLNLTTYQKT